MSRYRIPCLYKGKKFYMHNGKLTPATKEEEEHIYWKILNIPKYKGEKVDKKKLYLDILEISKKLFVLSEEIEYKIYSLWILSTWKIHAFESVGFISFVSQHNSGKTKLLEGIRLMGNKGVLASTTPAVIPKLSDMICALPLVDESHDLKNNHPQLFSFFKTSYRRGQPYIKSKNDSDKDVVVLANYGFKAFAGEEKFKNNALNDRCISINPEVQGIPKIQKFSYVKDELNSIRDRGLSFAKENDFNPDMGNEYTKLTGRTRELFEPLLVTAKYIGIPYDDIEEFALGDKERKKEEKDVTISYEVLEYINDLQKVFIPISDIIHYLGWKTDTVDDRRKAGAHLGYTFLDVCNIETSGRGFYGRFINLNDTKIYNKIKRLWKIYGISQKYDLRTRKSEEKKEIETKTEMKRVVSSLFKE
jgi:hypothetical protein